MPIPGRTTKTTSTTSPDIRFLFNKRRLQNNITRAVAYPGADIGSDHSRLIINFQFSSLKEEQEMMNELERPLLENQANTYTNINDLWETTKNIIQEVTLKEVEYNKK